MSKFTGSNMLYSVFKFFRSVKLAVILILIISLTSIISTLIPQNREPDFYAKAYGKVISVIILNSGFNNFFKSILFMVPSALFFINLAVCTIDRIRKRLLSKTKKRFGPDILHIGLLILIIGTMITFIGRKEAFISMAVGDEINLPEGYSINLKSFDFLRYKDNSPRDWISTVQLKKNGHIIREAFPIEVNKPLKAGRMKIYQSSYSVNNILYISDPEGTVYRLKPGQVIPVGKDEMQFRDIRADRDGSGNFSVIFARIYGNTTKEIVSLGPLDKIDIYTIESMDSQMNTGLQIVSDPGYFTVLVGLMLLALGLFLTYYQKQGDKL